MSENLWTTCISHAFHFVFRVCVCVCICCTCCFWPRLVCQRACLCLLLARSFHRSLVSVHLCRSLCVLFISVCLSGCLPLVLSLSACWSQNSTDEFATAAPHSFHMSCSVSGGGKDGDGGERRIAVGRATGKLQRKGKQKRPSNYRCRTRWVGASCGG